MIIGLVGTGVIGTGWAVRALAAGHDVVATDPSRGAAGRLREGVARAWPHARRLGVVPAANPSRLEFVDSIAEVAARAGFVQESVPEDLAIKSRVLAEIDAHAGPQVVVASSSSGLLPSKMQEALGHPERFVVGHPFNPVYLLPLVEVVAGSRTEPATVAKAVEHYEDLGMHPLVVRNEIEGYLADRLQEAMWREILHLVGDGVATTAELDAAIAYGPGLRWAGMGTNLTFHLAGGPGGMRAMLEHFGPALEAPWSHLPAPPLTPELVEAMSAGTEAQAAGRSVAELEDLRDGYLVSVLRALRAHGVGAGDVLARWEARIHGLGAARWQPGDDVPVPLRLYSCPVEPEWVDYNGHMTESAYLLAAGWASDALFRYVGIDEAYRAGGHSFYTGETRVRYLGEVGVDRRLAFDTHVTAVTEKRLAFTHVMREGERTVATVEQVLVHVDVGTGRSAPILPGPIAALDAIAAAHAGAEVPG